MSPTHAEVTGTEAPSFTPACAEGGRKDREVVKQQWTQAGKPRY